MFVGKEDFKIAYRTACIDFAGKALEECSTYEKYDVLVQLIRNRASKVRTETRERINSNKEKQVYYLNVAECMKDENGMLPDAASPADGMHFGPEYYNKWFDYLKQHTVSVPGGPAAASTTNVSASEPENSGAESQN